MIDRRYTDDARWQEDAGYSRAVRSGMRIAVSGTTASQPDGSAGRGGFVADAASAAATTGAEGATPGPTGSPTYRQTLDALNRAVAAVEALGGGVDDVVRTRIFLVPRADWTAAARAHREVFDTVRPANTMLFVASLVGDDLLVEVEVDAELSGETGTRSGDR